MTDRQLSKLFWYLVNQSDGEPLAQYIENGGDLADIGDREREVLARLVRGKSPRKRGQKLEKGIAERDWQLCLDVAMLKSGRSGSLALDACSVVADLRGLSEETVSNAWKKRDGFIKRLDEMYSEVEKSTENYIDFLTNAWKDN